MNLLKQRTLWLNIHLYLALGIGFFFAVMGLTGSLSIYRTAIDEFLNPRLVIEQTNAQKQPLNKIIHAVETAHPNLTGSWTLEMPSSEHGMITAWYDKPTETFFELYAPLMVSVHPYTAQVVESRYWGKTFTTWLLDLHTQLKLNKFGWNLIGCFGVLLCVSITTGLYLWWTDTRQFLKKFVVRHDLGLMRLLIDTHRLLGLIISPCLLVLAMTGINLSFPDVLADFVGTEGMEHGATGKIIVSTAVPNNHPTSLDAAEFMARSVFPKAELRRISTPVGETGVYRINYRQKTELNQRHPYSTVWVDRWSGQIKEVRNPEKFSTGEALLSAIYPIHSGEGLGSFGRFIWFLSGLALFFLYVSGVLYWLYKRGKVKDRAVNFAALRPLAQRWAINTLHAIKAAIRYATPHCKNAYEQLRSVIHDKTRR